MPDDGKKAAPPPAADGLRCGNTPKRIAPSIPSAARERNERVVGFVYDARLERAAPPPGQAPLIWECIKTATFNGEALRVDQVYDIEATPDGRPRPTRSETIVWSAGYRKRYIWNKDPNELWVKREDWSRAILDDPIAIVIKPVFCDAPFAQVIDEEALRDGSISKTVRCPLPCGDEYQFALYSPLDYVVGEYARLGKKGLPLRTATYRHDRSPEWGYAPRHIGIVEYEAGRVARVINAEVQRVSLNGAPLRSYFLLELPRGTVVIDEDSGVSVPTGETIDADSWLRRRDGAGWRPGP